MPTVTADDIRTIIVERIGVEEARLEGGPGLTLDELGLDSLGRVELVLAVEQEWGITVGDDAGAALTTVEDVVELANRHLAEVG